MRLNDNGLEKELILLLMGCGNSIHIEPHEGGPR